MIQTYLKTALRNLQRNKSYALINVLGLAVGIGACLLIFLVVRFENSFDDFHAQKNSIYRVGTEFHNQDGVSYSAGIAFPVAQGLRLGYPQIKVASIFKNEGQITIDNNNARKKLVEQNFYYADTAFFSMFNFPFLAGTATSALKDPTSAVLTQATAEKFFGNWKDALGKTIKYDNKTVYTITGILKNIPFNSDFPLSVVVPYAALSQTFIKNNLDDWVSTFGGAYTFIVLPPSMSPESFDKELRKFAQKHKPAEYSKDAYVTQPLTEIHFDDRFDNYTGQIFSHSLVNALSLIGLFLIVIACVNFVNLATAQAVNRSKEVGVRKVLGSSRRQLALQFLGETSLIVLFAMVLAVGLAFISLPFLNALLGVHISIDLIQDPFLVLFIVVAGTGVTLMSGLYPAFIISGFSPITALKGRLTSKMIGGISLRRGLVVFQFAIAHILIIGMFIVVSQMNFFRNASLGFSKAAIITVDIPGDSINHSKIEYLRNQLLANSNIQKVSFSFGSPSAGNNWNSDFKFDHATKSTNFSANLKWADADYFSTYNLQFVAGRPYSRSDTVREFVVNETLLRKLGITNPAAAIGKQLDFWDGRTVANIVGVIRDFNSYSLREPMAPVVLSTWNDVYQTLNIKIKPGAEKAVLPFIENLWNNTYPDYVYEYKFLDKVIENFYQQEDQLSQLYKIFAGIAIFISCLGLYGLVSFMAVQRTKEVGIRKILGASPGSIIFLLSKEFTLLILFAFLISAPIAWYIMHQWLQNYTYRIPMSATIFLFAIATSIVIAWITVAHKAIQAALVNPVKSLRNE